MTDIRKALLSACDQTNMELKKESAKEKSKYSVFKEFQGDDLTHVGPGSEEPTHYIPTGIWQFDQCYKGLPGGRYVETYGNYATGKTSLMSSVFANAQKMGGAALLLDRESTFLLERAILFGMDPSLYVRERARSIESAFIVVERWIANFYGALGAQLVAPPPKRKATKKKTVKKADKAAPRVKVTAKQEIIPLVVGWDTLAAIPSQFELDNPGVQRPGSMAKPIREAVRRQLHYMSELGVVTLFLNHETQKIGSFGGKTTPGGGMPKYTASFRLKLSKVYKGEIIFGSKENARIVGETFRLKVAKAKIGPQLLEFDYPIFHEFGYSQEYEIFMLLKAKKHPRLSGASGRYQLACGGDHLKFTRATVINAFKDHPEVFKVAKEEAKKLLLSQED